MTNGRAMRDAVLRWGLKVYCQRCGAEGRFFRPDREPELRLREVRCGKLLSDGETVCGGRLRAIPRDVTGERRANWSRLAVPYERPQLELWRQSNGR